MRGLILTNLYAIPSDPARGIFNQQQFLALNQLHELLVVVPMARRFLCASAASREAGSQERGAALPQVVRFNVWHPPLTGRLSNAAMVYLTLLRVCRGEFATRMPDYVMGSFAYPEGVAAVMLARRLGVPAFVKVHGTDINSMARRGWQRRQIGWALRNADGVIAVSRPLAEAVGRLGARQADTLVLRNGLDTQLFQPRDRAAARRRLLLPTERRSVLFVGNLKRAKGVMDLARAFSQLCSHRADVDLEYVGAGPAREELQQWITRNRLGDRVRLHGACAHEDITHWLGACDLLCLPSHAEGMPNVVVEALASGRPVVATDVGGIAELMTASNGRLVAAADPAGLESALRECLDIRWNAEQIASGVDAMNWAQNASRLNDFLRARCRRPPTANPPAANAPSADAPSADAPSADAPSTVASPC